MGTPTKAELDEALATAGAMREQNNDPHYLAKSLLNLHYRNKNLQEVMQAAELYLRGEGVTEHQNLLRAIDKAKRQEGHAAGRDAEQIMG